MCMFNKCCFLRKIKPYNNTFGKKCTGRCLSRDPGPVGTSQSLVTHVDKYINIKRLTNKLSCQPSIMWLCD